MSNADHQLRAVAITHVSALAARSGGVIPWSDVESGFKFRGETVHLATRARGIFAPTQLRTGALSIRTAIPREGRECRYDDQIASSEPYFEYRYQGDDPNSRDNRLVRECFRDQLPLLYFYGVAEARYRVFVVRIVADLPEARTFHVAPVDAAFAVGSAVVRVAAVPIERAYSIVEVRRRLHQDRFRTAVLGAYQTRCAVCNLGHEELLDAAHIIPDGEQLGEARVPNGLALCKLHHAAFDSQMLGISPVLKVHIRQDLLDERDGPMLEHGLRDFHGATINIPRESTDRPDRKLLTERWKRFAA